jgi:hypothetical protein
MDVNREAPALAHSEAVIAAEPEAVWEILAAFEDWPSWNPDVSSVTLEGGLAEGSVFRWKAGRSKITSRLVQVERPRLLGWTGQTAGIKAIHVWQLSPRDGGTLARTEESWEGLLVRVLPGPLRKSLQKAMDDGLGHLKAEAERRAQHRD